MRVMNTAEVVRCEPHNLFLLHGTSSRVAEWIAQGRALQAPCLTDDEALAWEYAQATVDELG